ncbi:MAG: alpha/beta hydrolase [Cyclobacteriaceae bacterium]|nr:alpha/beta hydrolase [Cyclobacteriaceae bacterium]
MEEKKTRFDYEARYFTAGNLNQDTRQVWIVFHGYGQLAQYFLRKFEPLTEHGIFLLAPEGLSRFYLSELTNAGRADNRVGATWMTRENRLMDIDNYIRYLNGVFAKELDDTKAPITLLAFSQGCATACRWATHGRLRFDRLILWAGLFPPDMDFEKGHNVLEGKKTYMVVGDQDPYLTSERMKEFDELSKKLGIQPEKVVFEGKHELNERVLRSLATNYTN